MRVRHSKAGREDMNSSISRQHMAKPRPLLYISAHQINLLLPSTSPICSGDKHIIVLFIIFWMEVAGLVHCKT